MLKKKSNAVELARGASYIVIQSILTYATLLISFPIIARLISPKEMGLWAILLLVNQFAQTIVTIGLPNAMTKYVAEHMSQGKAHIASAVFYQGFRITLVLACPLALAVFVGSNYLSYRLIGDASYALIFQVLSLDMIVYAGPLPVLVTTMYGLRKFKITAFVGTITNAMQQVLIIALIFISRNFVGLVMAWVITDGITVAIYFSYVTRTFSRPRFDYPLKRLLSYSLPLLFSGAVSFASAWYDRLLLAVFFPLATLGLYNVTITVFNALVGITAAIASVLLPAYSSRQKGRTSEDQSSAVRRASRYITILFVPLALGLTATAKPVLGLFAGNAYIAGAPSLVILTVIFALTIFGAALPPMLLALEETRLTSFITVVSVLVGLMTAFLLLPHWGMLGAAVSRGLSIIIVTALTFRVLRRKIGLKLNLRAIAKSLIAGSFMAIVVMAIQIPGSSKYLLPAYVVAGALVYLLSLRALKAVGQEDIELLEEYLGERLGFVANILNVILT